MVLKISVLCHCVAGEDVKWISLEQIVTDLSIEEFHGNHED